MQLTQEEEIYVRRIKAYYPWRRIWVLISPDKSERIIIAKETTNMVTQRVRKGWTGFEITFDKKV